MLVAVLSVFLYDRGPLLTSLYTNAPQRLVKLNTLKSSEIKFKALRSCEDVVLVEDEAVAILACDAGREKWNTVMVGSCQLV